MVSECPLDAVISNFIRTRWIKCMVWRNRIPVTLGVDLSSISVVVWCLAIRRRLTGKNLRKRRYLLQKIIVCGKNKALEFLGGLTYKAPVTISWTWYLNLEMPIASVYYPPHPSFLDSSVLSRLKTWWSSTTSVQYPVTRSDIRVFTYPGYTMFSRYHLHPDFH